MEIVVEFIAVNQLKDFKKHFIFIEERLLKKCNEIISEIKKPNACPYAANTLYQKEQRWFMKTLPPKLYVEEKKVK